MDYRFRRIEPSDHQRASEVGALRHEAFGSDAGESTRRAATSWCAVDSSDRVVGTADDIAFSSHFGGALVSTAGIGGVAIAPEHRGLGVAAALMNTVLTGARERGAVISTLFGGAPALYRRLGYGTIAHSSQWRIPLSKFSGIRFPAGYTLSRAGKVDFAGIAHLYAKLAAAGTAMAESSVAVADFETDTRHTVVRDPQGHLAGFCAWRTVTSSSGMTLQIQAIHGSSAAADHALLASLGSWGSMVEAVTVNSVDSAPFLAALPGVPTPVGTAPYMLRVLDPARAVAGRAWNSAASGALLFELLDPSLEENRGSWKLEVEGGRATLRSATSLPSVSLTAEGFALWYSGVASCSQLRRLGQLAGDDTSDALLDAMAAQADPTVTYHF